MRQVSTQQGPVFLIPFNRPAQEESFWISMRSSMGHTWSCLSKEASPAFPFKLARGVKSNLPPYPVPEDFSPEGRSDFVLITIGAEMGCPSLTSFFYLIVGFWSSYL